MKNTFLLRQTSRRVVLGLGLALGLAGGAMAQTTMLAPSAAVECLTPPPAEGRFYGRDAEAMARALKVEGRVSPFTVFATTSTNPDWQALKPSAPPAAFTNNHLGYALTWFGLAAALIAFYAVLLRRRLTRKDTTS